MIQSNLPLRQTGVALVLSLILLFVLTLVAVSSFTSSHVQERAASNSRLQTLAFETASAGASNAIDFYMQNVDDTGYAPDTLCGRLNHEGWGDENPTEWREETEWLGSDIVYSVPDVEVSLYQRIYCLNDEIDGTRPPRSQLFVASRGEVEANGNVVAIREVEVRIGRYNDTYTAIGCGALCFPACDYLMDGDEPLIHMPTSGALRVDGADGPAITTGTCEGSGEMTLIEAMLADFKGEGDKKLGHYDGGFHERDPGMPWNDPVLTDAFREEAMQLALSGDGLYIGPVGTDGTIRNDGPGSFDEATGLYLDTGNTDPEDINNPYGSYGTDPANPVITYVKGDLEVRGNLSGAGIMIVEGDIKWNGTPDYQGLIVTLGGTFTVDGAGEGGNHAGSVVVLNNNGETGCSTYDPETCSEEFGAVGFDADGGGKAQFNWNCDAIKMALGLVEGIDYIEANAYDWGVDCDRSDRSLFETPADLVIASWRENIGWREDYFAAE